MFSWHKPVVGEPQWQAWVGVAGCLLASSSVGLATGIFSASLPDIEGALGAGADQGTWFNTCYVACEGAVMLTASAISTIVSFRRLFLGFIITFAVGSLLGAVTQSIGLVFLARALQGLGGGAITVLAFQSVFRFIPKNLRGVAMLALAMAGSLPATSAVFVSAHLFEGLGFRALFALPLVMLPIATALILGGIPAQPPQWERLRSFDWLSAVLSFFGIGGLITALDQANRLNWFDNPPLMILLAVSLLLIGAFIAVDARNPNPMINFGVLREPHFAVACMTNLVFRLGVVGSLVLIPQFLAITQEYRPLESGAALLWTGLPQVLLAFVVLEAAHLFDMRLLIGGSLVVLGISSFLASQISPFASGRELAWLLLLSAVAQAFFVLGTYINGPSRLTPPQGPSAGGLFNLSRSIGQALGGCWLTWLVNHQARVHAAHILEGITPYGLQDRSSLIASQTIPHFVDPSVATGAAGSVLAGFVQRNALTMALNDAWLATAIAMFAGAALVAFSTRFNPADLGWQAPIRQCANLIRSINAR